MNCPKCVGRLEETELVVRKSSKIPELGAASLHYELQLDKCFVCGGIWFDKGELRKYLGDGITVLDSPSLGADMDRELDRKQGDCPQCLLPLVKSAAPYNPEIVTDICQKCGGVWLDSSEIDRLERAANKNKFGFLDLFLKGFRRSDRTEDER